MKATFHLCWLFAIATIVVLGFAGCGLGTRINDKVTSENYQRIKMGMTKADVQAILGPGETVETRDLSADERKMSLTWMIWVRNSKDRAGDSITVGFDSDGKVQRTVHLTFDK